MNTIKLLQTIEGEAVLDNTQQIEKWFVEYGDDIYNYLMYYTGNADVEDLVQEVFIKALKGIKGFKGISTPKTWLFTIARHTAIDFHRKQRPFKWLPYDSLDHLPSADAALDEKLQLNEEMESLYCALNKLKQNYREVLLLRGIKGLSPSETAEILNWSELKVNSTLHRALKALKKQAYSIENGGLGNERL